MTTCPKCQYTRAEKDGIISTQTCPRCGIIYSKWTPGQASENDIPAQESNAQTALPEKSTKRFTQRHIFIFALSVIIIILLVHTFIISAWIKPVVPQETLEYTSPAIGATFVSIHPGTFSMGSPWTEDHRKNNETQHNVTISKLFYMQTTTVTQGQWRIIMGNNPSYNKSCGDDCPVESISWKDAKDFITKLNQAEKTRKYRLPTEAEWEYAARAGVRLPFHTGRSLSKGQANYLPPYYDKEPMTIRVASFAPNNWGLYDMHGNVSQWVEDWYGDYGKDDATDPSGPDDGTQKVIRGCSYMGLLPHCRCAYRGIIPLTVSYPDMGFRLVWDPNL